MCSPDDPAAPAKDFADELAAALEAVREERRRLPELERRRRDAEFARAHPELLSDPARVQRHYAQYRREGERIGHYINGAIEAWAGTAAAMLSNPKASPKEKRRAAQLAIIAAGLKRIL